MTAEPRRVNDGCRPAPRGTLTTLLAGEPQPQRRYETSIAPTRQPPNNAPSNPALTN